jgi:valyl-tRNA synthetase
MGGYHESIAFVQEVLKPIITEIRSLRADKKIEPNKKINVFISAGSKTQLLKRNQKLIKDLKTGIENLVIETKFDKPQNTVALVVGQVEVFVDLVGAIDVEKEKSRISKELDEAQKYVVSLEKKLGNEQFVNNAPVDVVQKEKEKLKTQQEKIEKLHNQLKNLI